MSNPGDLILAATLPELSFTATAIPNANAALQSALPALTFTAQAVTRTDAALVGNFPPLAMLGEARYQSYAVRPITGQSSTRWRHASRHSSGAEDRREATSHLHEASRAQWQIAGPWVVGVENRRTSTRVRAPLARQTWHQGAAPVQSGAALGHADAIRLRTARRTAFDEAIRAEWLNWAIRHQDGWRDRRFAAASTYQEAQRYAGHFHAEGIRSAVYLRRWWGGALAGGDAPPTGSPSGGAVRAASASSLLRVERTFAVCRGRRHRRRPLVRLRALRPAAGRVGARSHPEGVFRDQ